MQSAIRQQPSPAWIVSCLLLCGVSGCNGPFLLLPGGRLPGESQPAPANWDFADDYGTAQLETSPDEPYSVNLAYTVMNGRLYVNAGDTQTRWVENMQKDSRVRLRLQSVLYDLRAERVTDATEIDAFAAAWTGQSMFRRDPREMDEVWIYRLRGR